MLIAISVPHLTESTHVATRGRARIAGREPTGPILGFERIEMMGDLRFQVRIEPAPAEQVDEPTPHHSPPVGLARNFAITATVDSQLSVSSAICLRPRAVSS